MKQRLDARQSMTLNEYVDATLALLADNRAYAPSEFNDMMHHLRKVVRDALERSWPSVRRWTQFIWDSVESGDMGWSNRDVIQEERVRLCLTANSLQTAQESKRQNNVNQVICRQFNTRMGCKHRESHGDAHVWELHCCSYCDSIGKSCFHSVRECERRLAHARNDIPYQQNRNRTYNPLPQHQQPSNQYNSYNPAQFSKNGQ